MVHNYDGMIGTSGWGIAAPLGADDDSQDDDAYGYY